MTRSGRRSSGTSRSRSPSATSLEDPRLHPDCAKQPSSLASRISVSQSTPSLQFASLMLRAPLFVASLGNPPPAYANTLHSAGHTLLTAVALYSAYPPFSKSRPYANGSISRGIDALLWQSPTLMNVSGPAVATAWKAFLGQLDLDAGKRAKLVIVHDELENALGKIKVKVGGSAKGHNGLKSCATSLSGISFTRIGVGIGRPLSKESGAVADYVLRKMRKDELEKVEASAPEVSSILAKMSEGS